MVELNWDQLHNSIFTNQTHFNVILYVFVASDFKTRFQEGFKTNFWENYHTKPRK